jgi:hypothetical protein
VKWTGKLLLEMEKKKDGDSVFLAGVSDSDGWMAKGTERVYFRWEFDRDG